jgi:hypothetical protein
MKFFITIFVFLISSVFILGCSRSPKESSDYPEGTVSKIFSKGNGENILTEKDPNEATLVSLNKIREIIDDMQLLIGEINEISVIISSYQSEEADIAELLKSLQENSDQGLEEENEVIAEEAGEEDGSQEENEGNKEEKNENTLGENEKRDKIIQAIEKRVKAIEEFGKEINGLNNIKDDQKGKIIDLLIEKKELLAKEENNLAQSDPEDFSQIAQNISDLKILGGELPRFQELSLAYRGNFLIEGELNSVFLEAEEKIDNFKDKGADVSQAELILAKARQASINTRKIFSDIQFLLEKIEFSKDPGANEVVSSRIVESLASAGENLGIVREALFSLSAF